MQVLEQELLSRHTSFKVGGPAKVYVIPESPYELTELVKYLYEKQLAYRIIGNGSNILASDSGVPEVVVEIRQALTGMEVLPEKPGAIRVLAGTLLSDAAAFACENGLQGLEPLSGIPGTVGGAVTMNAGAYGAEIRDVLESAEVVTPEGEVRTLQAAEMDFRYRHSVIPDRNYIVLAATLRLQKGAVKEIQEAMKDFRERRESKQPLEKASAGSTFKRPEGHYAGQLIDEAGLRGFRIGGAAVSEKHCGFVINDDGASAWEVYELIHEVIRRVRESSGVELTPEVKLWGSF